jgi:Zn-dependent protease with chaperone function
VTKFPALLGRQSGELELHRDRILLRLDSEPTRLIVVSLSNLEVEIGGTNSALFFLSDRLSPNEKITIQDESLVRLLGELGHQKSKDLLNEAKRRKSIRIATAATPVVLILGLVLIVPLFLSAVPVSWLEGRLTHSQERKVGELILPSLVDTKADFAPGPQAALQRIAMRLREYNPELNRISFDIRISSSEDVNAFALPGGIIVMNRGLLMRATSVEEVAGVLAHEMAHVERRHTLRSLAGRLGFLGGFILLNIILSPDAAVLVGKSLEVAQLKYSRDDEREADEFGHKFLLNAGIDPAGMISFFKKLGETEKGILGDHKSATSKAAKIFSTHPLSGERVENLERLGLNSKASKLSPKSRRMEVTLDELRSGF